MSWKHVLLIGSGLSAVAVGILVHKMTPSLTRLARVASYQLQGLTGTQPVVKTEHAVRIGILGAANIAPFAVVWPAFRMDHVVVVAVAARDPVKAQQFATKYGIPKVHETYQDLINDPELDAIYNPLPNGYHAYWTIQALRAGKHVLCEKPMASNSQEAQAMKEEAEQQNLLLVEAFHYRYHPMMTRLHELIQEYTPEIQHVHAEFSGPSYSLSDSDIRFNVRGQFPELAGGALMDTGCYVINFLRHVVGNEPVRATQASVDEAYPGVDRRVEAVLEFADSPATASFVTGFHGWTMSVFADITGSNRNRIHVVNFPVPFVYSRIDVLDEHNQLITSEKVYEDGETPWVSTYEFQLDAFAKAVQGDPSALQRVQEAGSAQEAVLNMEAIGMIYKAAGMEPRQGFSGQ